MRSTSRAGAPRRRRARRPLPRAAPSAPRSRTCRPGPRTARRRRGWWSCREAYRPPRGLILVQPLHEGDRARREQEGRLLDRHRDRADLLILERREAPQLRRPLVEVVERLREREQERDRRRGDERAEEEEEPRLRAHPARRDDRPPEGEAGAKEREMLEPERPAVLERVAVHRWKVQDVPGGEPDGQRDRRSGDGPHPRAPLGG